MKNTLLAVFITTTVAFGTLCVVQWQKLATQKQQITALRLEAEQRTQEIAEFQDLNTLNEKQRQDLLEQADDLAKKLQARQQADATVAEKTPGSQPEGEAQKPGKDKNPFSGFLAKMMDDPDTKKMIRGQQRMMLDQLYNPLIKKLGLTPEEAGQFKDLLADNMMKSAEKATSLFGGATSTNRTEMLEKLASEQKDFDEQLRGFLGETRYAQYKEYQQTVGERTLLSQFQQQTAGGDYPVNDQQTEKLLRFMNEEKQAIAAATGQPVPGDNQDAATMQAMLSGEGTERFLQNQEAINQRVYERARDILSAEQLAAFGQFQTNQLQMMRMGMTMAQKFMAPDGTGNTSGAPNP